MNDGQATMMNQDSVSRRRFLRVAGAGVAGSTLLTMIEARQAPAQIKGSNLRILTWSHFIPAYDTWFDKMAKDWGDKNGVKVRVDHIPHLEIPARMAAEFAAGAGHDILFNGSTILTRIYYKNLADLTDVYDQVGKKYGGWIPAARSPVEVEGRIYGMPVYYILLPMIWRKDLFDQAGLKAPDTWELARVAARTLKAKGHPTGIQFSHCNDANLNWRSVLFSFGGSRDGPVRREPGDRLQGDARGVALRQGSVRRGHDPGSVLVGRRLGQSLPRLGRRVLGPRCDLGVSDDPGHQPDRVPAGP